MNPPHEDVRGHGPARQDLARIQARSIALIGPAGVGRRRVAQWYGAYLNCARREAAPCGDCPSCRLMPGAHPDYREIAPVHTTTTGRAKRQREYRIDQLVERPRSQEEPLSRWLAHRPRFACRVAVIDDADALNASAANAFLKTLEEPPEWARVVLIAPSLDALLPTIASRCTPVRCGPVATGAFEHLAPHPALETGRLGPLERAAGDPDRWTEIRETVEAFVDALSGPLLDALEASDRLEAIWSEHDADDVTDLLRFALRSRWPAAAPQMDRCVERCEEAFERYANTTLATRVLALALRRATNPAGAAGLPR